MTPILFLVITIGIILFWAFILMVYQDDNVAWVVVVLMLAISLVIAFKATPSIEEMEINKYQNILHDKPECMQDNADGHDIACLKDYRKWLDDSLNASNNLARIAKQRDSILADIKFRFNNNDTTKEKE